MNTSKRDLGASPSRTHGWDRLRDPAVWAWLIVALLALLPAKAALVGA